MRRIALQSALRGLWLALLLGVAGSSADAQVPQLSIDLAEVFEGQTAVPLDLRLTNPDPVEAIEIGLLASGPGAVVTDLLLQGGVLDGVALEFAAVAITAGGSEVSILWILDSTAPFDPVLAPGNDQRLAAILVDIADDFPLGTSVFLDFVDGVGVPPATNLITSGGAAIAPDTIPGQVTRSGINLMAVQSEPAAVGEFGHPVEVLIRNTANVQGFSSVLTFDPTLLQCAGVSIDGTITDAVGAEFVEEIIENTQGYAILGVLLDVIPPFDSQVIPASGLELAVAHYLFDVDDQIMGDVLTPIRFQDGLGNPPIENIFVIGNQSIQPTTEDTVLLIEGFAVFLRGDADRNLTLDLADIVLSALYVTNTLGTCPACPPITCESALDSNDDGDADLADAIYLGSYLFLAGPQPPPPFPAPGPDPTPDTLFCD